MRRLMQFALTLASARSALQRMPRRLALRCMSSDATPVDVASLKLERKGRRREVNWVVPEGMEDSLIPETLKRMEEDETFQITAKQLKEMGAVRLSREERQRRRRALDRIGVPSFQEFVEKEQVDLSRLPTTVLQMNIGLYCNQACNHCHVGTARTRCPTAAAQDEGRTKMQMLIGVVAAANGGHGRRHRGQVPGAAAELAVDHHGGPDWRRSGADSSVPPDRAGGRQVQCGERRPADRDH
eukprot:scaffold7938_cov286-Pinguiococcus_pyrenoidosus.AAC.2